jgi:hypothetical protein
MLAMGVVGAAEIVKDGDGLHEAFDGLRPERRDAGGDDGATTAKVFSQLVIEHSDAFRIRVGHGYLRLMML